MNQYNIFSQATPLFEFLKKQRENQRIAHSIEIGATFLFVSFFLFFAIRPTATTISALIGETKSKEILVRQMRSKISNVIQAQDNFAKIENQYNIIKSSLPDSPGFVNTVTQMRGVAEKTLLNMEKINFTLENPEEKPIVYLDNKNVKSYAFNFSTKAPFSSAVNFLDRIFLNRRLIDLNNITLSSVKEGEGQPGAINVNFSSNIFYWNNQK